MNKTLNLVYFAWVRQEIGLSKERLDYPKDLVTVADLITHLKTLGSNYAKAFEHPDKLRCAVNQQFAEFDHKLGDADEVAFFPPVTGG